MAEGGAAPFPGTRSRERRSRQLPAHLQEYQVNLPQSLSLSKALSASTPELRSSSRGPELPPTDDQLPTVLGHQMRTDQRPRDKVDDAALSALARQLSGSLGPQHLMMKGYQDESEVDSEEDRSISGSSIKCYSLPQSSHTPVAKPTPPHTSHTTWAPLPSVSSHPGQHGATQPPAGHTVPQMSYTSLSVSAPTAAPPLIPASGGHQYAPQSTNTSWSQSIPQPIPATSQPPQWPTGMVPTYHIPQPGSHPSVVMQPTPTSAYQSGYTISTQPGPLPVSSTPYAMYGAPVAAVQQYNQLPPAWSSVPYAMPHHVFPGLAPSYSPAHTASHPVQPRSYPPYPQYAAPPVQPTASVQSVPQPPIQSFPPGPSLPLQPVPIPALPKLVNDSEREFTDLKMALDHLLNPHVELSEHYKYRVLMEQLVLEEARLIAQSCRHHAQPYTASMQALQREYGQPHQLAQGEIAAILNSPDVRAGDSKAFQSFALRVDLLVGMLTSLEGPQGLELMSTGHVDRLLSKLPRHLRDSFIEHLQVRGRLQTQSLNPYNLRDLAEWLKVKAEAQRLSAKMCQRNQTERPLMAKREKIAAVPKQRVQPVTIYHGSNTTQAESELPTALTSPNLQSKKVKVRICLFCKSNDHYLSQCPTIMTQTVDQIETWITKGKRCSKCGRTSHGPVSVRRFTFVSCIPSRSPAQVSTSSRHWRVQHLLPSGE